MKSTPCRIASLTVLILFLKASPTAAERQYAPDREVDITHVIIDVTPDFDTRTVRGKTTIRFSPIARPVRELRLSAFDLRIQSVTSKHAIAGYVTDDKQLTITFTKPIPPDAESQVVITYEAEPREGLYFRTPGMGYREQDTHLFTQGETHRAPHWYPCFDYPNERFTSEVICHAPADMTVLSNGKRVSETTDAAKGIKTVRWLQDKPHVNYLIALVVGRLKGIHETYRDIPLGFYTPSSRIEQAQNSFRGTARMMAYFEREIGVPYPWHQYNQAVVEDFVAGGMENTTLTILTHRTLFTDASETIRSSRNLVAHELVHQWFGDYVTCKDWGELWLNEGFATYYALLYEGHDSGQDELLYGLYRDAQRIVGAKDSPRPIVNRIYGKPWSQFDYRSYKKGSWVLHMLRTQLGEDLYRRCIKTYLERHALRSVVTADLLAVIEELSGLSWDRFFDQWLYHARHPELKIGYEWTERDRLAKVSVRQTQKVTNKVLLFELKTKVRFKCGSTTIDRDIEIDEDQQDFYFALPEKPDIVRFDPEYGVLAKVDFAKPTEMLYAQLGDHDDVIGRLRAAAALRKKDDKKTVAKLKDALNGDPFYGVRIEASKALREMHTDEAFAAIAASLKQPDARVRQQVVRDLGGFFRNEVPAKLKAVVQREKNPDIVAAALHGLGRYAASDVREILLKQLRSESYQNRVAAAAIDAIRTQEDPAYAGPLMEVLRQRGDALTSYALGRGLETLAYITRHEEDRNKVREFIAGYVNDKRVHVQAGAIRALGELKDPKGLRIVETFVGEDDDDPIRRAARQARDKLGEAQSVPVQLRELRQEVLKLKEYGADLEESVEGLEGKLEAMSKRSTTKPASTKPASTTKASTQPGA